MGVLEKVPFKYKAGAVVAGVAIAYGATQYRSANRLPFDAELAVQTDNGMHGGHFDALDLSTPILRKPVTVEAIDQAANKIGEMVGYGDFGKALGYCSIAAANKVFEQEPLGQTRQDVLAKVANYSFAHDANRIPPTGVLEDCIKIDHTLLVPGKTGYSEITLAPYGSIK